MGRPVLPFAVPLLLLAVAAPAARSDEPAKPPEAKPAEAKIATDAEAKEALESFARQNATEDLDFRREAVRRLAKTVHATVADRLLGLALKDAEVLVRAEAFKGLLPQRPFAKAVGPKVARWLGDAAEENRKAKARGDYGVRVDPKTGEVDTESEEGKAMLRAKRERGRMLAEAVKLVRDWEYRDRESVEVLEEFLSDGNDDLVALVLDCFGRWKEWSVLPDLLDLFDIYPKEDGFETGSVSVDTGASGSTDQQAAKRKWMAKFGDPDKRRPRPKVVQALKKALLDITGQEFKTPKELREYLKRPEVKRKVRAG